MFFLKPKKSRAGANKGERIKNELSFKKSLLALALVVELFFITYVLVNLKLRL